MGKHRYEVVLHLTAALGIATRAAFTVQPLQAQPFKLCPLRHVHRHGEGQSLLYVGGGTPFQARLLAVGPTHGHFLTSDIAPDGS